MTPLVFRDDATKHGAPVLGVSWTLKHRIRPEERSLGRVSKGPVGPRRSQP